MPAEYSDVLDVLRRIRAATMDTTELLRSSKLVVEANTRQLENPKAIVEYLDFFLELFARTVSDFDRLIAELAQGFGQEHLDLLRQVANNAAAEQRRCLIFRDRWINKPLPYEQMRPVLNQISNDSRDQLTEYKALLTAADQLEALAAAPEKPPGEEGKLGRRELFTRWFGR